MEQKKILEPEVQLREYVTGIEPELIRPSAFHEFASKQHEVLDDCLQPHALGLFPVERVRPAGYGALFDYPEDVERDGCYGKEDAVYVELPRSEALKVHVVLQLGMLPAFCYLK